VRIRVDAAVRCSRQASRLKARSQPREAVEDGGTYLQLSDLPVEVAPHDTLTQQFGATHFGFDDAAPMLASLLLPVFPTK